jgi:hypothetical protein
MACFFMRKGLGPLQPASLKASVVWSSAALQQLLLKNDPFYLHGDPPVA